MNAIRMLIIHKDGEDGKWIAFSDNYEWVYVAHYQDDFIKFLLETLPAVERHSIVGDDVFEDRILYLENERFLHYSFQTDFLMEIKSKELPLGEVHHKFWCYNWAHDISMKGANTDTYTLNETELELLNQDVNDLFNRGFFHQSSSEYFLTEDVEPEQSVWVFEATDDKYYFTSQLYDQKAPTRDLTWYHLKGQLMELNILMLPGLNTLMFKEGLELSEFLTAHECTCIEKTILNVESKKTESGKTVLLLQLEGEEFLFINRSEKEKYIDGQIFERGHYRRLFYLHNESIIPASIESLVESDVKLIWHGNSRDVHAPEYVKSFVRLKHEDHEQEEREGRIGCILISLIAAGILALLVYWIFW